MYVYLIQEYKIILYLLIMHRATTQHNITWPQWPEPQETRFLFDLFFKIKLTAFKKKIIKIINRY